MRNKLATWAFFFVCAVIFFGAFFLSKTSAKEAWERIFSIVHVFAAQFIPKNTGAGIVLVPISATSAPSRASKTEKKTPKAKSSPMQDKPQKKPVADSAVTTEDQAKAPPQTENQEKKTIPPAASCAVFPNAVPQQNAVVFNEIAWMGTVHSPNDEWIELKNVGDSPVPMAGWQIADKDEGIKIVFGDTHFIPPQGLFLLERTDDSSVPAISADIIYKGALSNENEELYLFDSHCVLRDKVTAHPNWPAGENDSRKTMERDKNLEWHTYGGQGGNEIFGTPKAENSSASVLFVPNTPQVGGGGGGGNGYLKILISEVQIAGTNSQTEEFVEFYNPNSQDVDVTDWYLQKKTKSAAGFSTFVSSSFFVGKIIKAQGYFLIARKGSSFESAADITTESSLAQDNTLALKNPSHEIVDKVGWGGAQDFEGTPAQNPADGKSIGRIFKDGSYGDTDSNANDFEIQTPSPKARNISPAPLPAPESPAPASASVDATPPAVQFDVLAGVQAGISFSIFWTGTDSSVNDVSPSGINAFYLQYAVSPSADGVLLKYESNGALQNWNQGAGGELTFSASVVSVSVSAQDGIAYIFSLKAKDGAGNESAFATASTSVGLPKTVVINEVAWMGTQASANDEWMELYNNTDSAVDMAGWKLKSADGTPSIILMGTIGAHGYYLLERTNDSTVSDIAADKIYTGALGNSGENLELYNAQNTLIDALDASAGWFAGNNTTKQTMERIGPLQPGSKAANWASSIQGTPKQANSVLVSP